jgi:hypothetical protein
MGQLAEAFSTTLDAAGRGTVRLRPSSMRTTWLVQSVQVAATSNAAEPTANVFLGSETGQNLGGTYTGSNDTCSGMNTQLYPGQYLTVLWTGGDPGAVATATAYGTTSTWGT